jgi:uncharacterized protein
MSDENVEVARRGYAAMNEALSTGDFSPVAELWHPEVVLKPSGLLPEQGEWRGQEGITRFAAAQAEAFEEFQVKPEEFIDAGDKVVVPIRFGGRARHTGLSVEFRVVHVLSLRDGKLARIDMFQSLAKPSRPPG